MTLSEGRLLDWTIILYLAKRLITKFEKWPAFKAGIIDKKGKLIRKPTSEERKIYTPLDSFIRKIRIAVGDNILLKLGLPFLLAKEDIFDSVSVKILSEQVDGETVEISKDEDVAFEFSKKDNSFRFFIKSIFDGVVLQKFGDDEIPIENLFLLETLNNIFLRLSEMSDEDIEIEEIIITDKDGEEITITVTFSKSEIKIESSVSEESENLGKVFITFENEESLKGFLQSWVDFLSGSPDTKEDKVSLI